MTVSDFDTRAISENVENGEIKEIRGEIYEKKRKIISLEREETLLGLLIHISHSFITDHYVINLQFKKKTFFGI